MWCCIANDYVSKSKVSGLNLSFVRTLSSGQGAKSAFKIATQSWGASSVGKAIST